MNLDVLFIATLRKPDKHTNFENYNYLGEENMLGGTMKCKNYCIACGRWLVCEKAFV